MSIKKKLSDEDIKYWLALTKTLDSKKYNHLKKQNFCDANDTYFQKKLDLEKNLIFKKEKVIKKLDEKKYFRDVILEDIRIDKKKLNLLKRGKLEPEIILDLHGMNTVIAKKKSIEIKSNPFGATKASRIILPSSVLMGIFCKLGSEEDSLPVVVTA